MRVFLFAAIVLAGCKGQPSGESSCTQAGARFFEMASAKVAASTDVGERERVAVTGLLAPMRDSLIRACRDDGWSAEARACFTSAIDETMYYACETRLSPDQRAKLARSAAGK